MGLFEPARLLRKRLCSTCPDESSSLPPPLQEKNPQPTQKRLPIKTSPHQCDALGIDLMSSPHLRINCADPGEDSCPGRINVHVLSPSRVSSKLSCHCTGTVTVVFPGQTNTTTTCVRTMDQSYPLIHPGPGANPPIYPPFLTPARRGLPEARIPKDHSFFSFSQCLDSRLPGWVS